MFEWYWRMVRRGNTPGINLTIACIVTASLPAAVIAHAIGRYAVNVGSLALVAALLAAAVLAWADWRRAPKRGNLPLKRR